MKEKGPFHLNPKPAAYYENLSDAEENQRNNKIIP